MDFFEPPTSKIIERRKPRGHYNFPSWKGNSTFVSPRPASPRSKPRHRPVRRSLRAIQMKIAPGTEDLSASLCTSAVSRNAGFWVPVSRQEDPLLQKIVVAKNLTLERPPFRDCYLYQYGVLPDQYLVPRADHAVSLHVSDKMDAKLPRSLVQMVASKSHRNGRQLSDRLVVSAWDGTMRNVTAPLLWRTQEPLF